MQNCCPVGLQLGGQKIAVPSLGDNAAGCTQITRIMAMQKLSFMVRIAVFFFDIPVSFLFVAPGNLKTSEI
jgi:hypothetical protein